jgi:hypothetical protein
MIDRAAVAQVVTRLRQRAADKINMTPGTADLKRWYSARLIETEAADLIEELLQELEKGPQ